MAKGRRRDEWLRDVDARQRNVVFPDTANNEGRFWRNIINGKERLTGIQKLGILLVFLTLLTVFLSLAGFSFRGLASVSLAFLASFGLLALFLAIFSASQWLGRVSRERRSRR